MSEKEKIIECYKKEFNRLYFLIKAYWYGTLEYNDIPEFMEWANDYIHDLLNDYSGECRISSFKKHVKEQLDEKIKLYITQLSKEVN